MNIIFVSKKERYCSKRHSNHHALPSFPPSPTLLPYPLGSGGETSVSGGVHFTAQSAVQAECTGQCSGYSVVVLHFTFKISWAYCRVFYILHYCTCFNYVFTHPSETGKVWLVLSSWILRRVYSWTDNSHDWNNHPILKTKGADWLPCFYLWTYLILLNLWESYDCRVFNKQPYFSKQSHDCLIISTQGIIQGGVTSLIKAVRMAALFFPIGKLHTSFK